ncbi:MULTISPECIES: hypothetical protein [unclassified Variovorax]|uniref:hypothetical protein n=1 Tax=unclassified Variovorax TaxID=663243 RepID=UPI0013166BA9|nr:MULTISPECIES: hypothetical protein [unclassified Variovorax]VTU18003.1 hypothetical protein SRS16CHR_02144 [Variovorax sp. SRS16]VTU22084.1 hypothetical protein E5CHR_01318 [Variovorax sp. PBL-E5]
MTITKTGILQVLAFVLATAGATAVLVVAGMAESVEVAAPACQSCTPHGTK